MSTLKLDVDPFEIDLGDKAWPEGQTGDDAAYNAEFDLEELEWEEEARRTRRFPSRPAGRRPRRSRIRRSHYPRPYPRPLSSGRGPRRPPRPWPPKRPKRPFTKRHGLRRPLAFRGPIAPCVCPAHGTEFIRWVQSSLNQLFGLRLRVNGLMARATREALCRFQEQEGLTIDGIAGPETEQALIAARSQRRGRAPEAPEPGPEQSEWYEFDTLELESPATQPLLRRGSRGSAVIDLQNRLTALGFNPGAADGIFGSLTEAAVKSFQRSRGLSIDGLVGSQTWGALLETEPAAPSPPQRPTGEPQVTKGSSAKVSDNAVRVLKGILRDAGLTHAMITSGRRTSTDQARIMYDLIERNSVSYAKNLYGRYGDAVIDVYDAQKRAGKSATEIKQAMENKIKEIGCQKVSHHCSDAYDVFDVGPSSISDHSAFQRALQAAQSRGIIDKYITPPQDPAFHIEIKLKPATYELMAEILSSPPLSLDAFVPRRTV